MKVVISIGGSVIASPKPNVNYIKNFSQLIKKLTTEGHDIKVVVGGGAIAREYIQALRELGASEDYCDKSGILATRLNAMLISAAFGVYKDIPEDLNIKCSDIFIIGGIKPGQTTDAVSAEIAAKCKADLLINATNVDGIYDSDPRKNPSAIKLKEIKSEKLIELVEQVHKAGLSTIIDPVAAKIIHRNKIRTIVLDGRNLESIEKAIKGENHGGTLVS
jgi:uridylate kinase